MAQRDNNYSGPWTWQSILKWALFFLVAGHIVGFALATVSLAQTMPPEGFDFIDPRYDPYIQPGFWSDLMRIWF